MLTHLNLTTLANPLYTTKVICKNKGGLITAFHCDFMSCFQSREEVNVYKQPEPKAKCTAALNPRVH